MSGGSRGRPRVGILADDFTGAADVALAFDAAGFSTEIHAPDGARPGFPAPGVEAWVIDTESRELPPARAAARVRRALGRLARWRAEFIFKKIDSTLRGPLGAELAAFVDWSGAAAVPVVPAFPRLGRTTRAGRHYVDGVLLHRSPFGRDPRHPVRTSRIAAVLGLPVELRDRVRVPDAGTDRDLARIARRSLAAAPGGVPVAAGSAGFAAALAKLLAFGHPAPARKAVRPFGRGPVGVVIGSAHPASERQALVLKRRLNNFSRASVGWVQAPLARGDPRRILTQVTRRAAALERTRKIRRWVVTGGETAFALARRWKAGRWRLAGSVEPGIAICRSAGRPARWLALKPGGFGSDSALWKAWRLFAGTPAGN